MSEENKIEKKSSILSLSFGFDNLNEKKKIILNVKI